MILYDEQGRRQIHVDLKNIQELIYPPEVVETALQPGRLGARCATSTFHGPCWPAPPKCRQAHCPGPAHSGGLTTPTTAIFARGPGALYERRAPAAAPRRLVRAVWAECSAEVVVIGLSAQGALLGLRGPR